MTLSHLGSCDRTDVGRKRKLNEDSVLRMPSIGVFCVADGMGGAEEGDIASQAVVESLEQSLLETAAEDLSAEDKVKMAREALNNASQWLWKRSERKGKSGTGSTAMILVFDSIETDRVFTLHAGDTRAYCYRKGRLKLLTRDHSIASDGGFKDEADVPSMFRGVITKAVGIKPDVEPDESCHEVKANDLFLLCSDGLTRMVPDKKLIRLFRLHEKSDLETTADALIDAANRKGGDDNISVILVQVRAPVNNSVGDSTETDDSNQESSHSTSTVETRQ